jgi:hypothetical protein
VKSALEGLPIGVVFTSLLFLIWSAIHVGLAGIAGVRINPYRQAEVEDLKVKRRFKPTFVLQYITVLSSVIFGISICVKKRFTVENPDNVQFTCYILGPIGIAFYLIAKIGNAGFIGLRASLAYLHDHAKKARMIRITAIFLLGFVVLIIAIFPISQVIRRKNLECSLFVPVEWTYALLAWDLTSSIIGLIMFLVPLQRLANESSGSGSAPLQKVIRENTILGVISTASSTIIVCISAFYLEKTLDMTYLSLIDLLITCICQIICTRKLWKFECSYFRKKDSEYQVQLLPSTTMHD